MIIAFTCDYTKGGIAQSVGTMELERETIIHDCLFFYGQCSGNVFIPQFYKQTVNDIRIFCGVYTWKISGLSRNVLGGGKIIRYEALSI